MTTELLDDLQSPVTEFTAAENPKDLQVSSLSTDLIVYLAKALATQPEQINLQERVVDAQHVVLELNVAAADRGQIIGKKGRMAQAMRVLLRVAAEHKQPGMSAALEIID